ncbi:hypothetical protein [Pseudomonas sp. LP_7_YM]|uniref:hypothetical protein n=1 Tax=Pseudomonas sp. LP_7_YM TaxID=2485137 RepID=UPI0010CF2ABE|nr:hypothetical protein [Pseudomonas sp. LP_7_YM]TDV60277.1 hypothetical protein EC915_1123 [Pseudomonas sp. LP_7_YM]
MEVGAEIDRVKQRKESRELINALFQDSTRVYVIHYSCESFYEGSTGASKRVTSIAVRNLKTGQTSSWSLHKSAELDGQLESMHENLDRYEKSMLDGYFTFLEQHSGCRFIHWNMRDEHFGFYALEHRYRVLKGVPYELQDDKKVDLARVLVDLFGKKYAPHEDSKGRSGRIMSLAELNKVTDKDALSGKEEAAAFVTGDFLKMHRSTLRKLDMFANFFERTHKGDLVTKASWLDRVGVHPVAVIEWLKSHPVVSGFILIGAILGAIVKYEAAWQWARSLF